jgi:iron complex transport system ATP-binding protein
VILARSLAQETPVLMLDEATSNLDINHAISVLRLAAERVANKGQTVVAVMQDINLAAMFCDYLIFMREGSIRTQGPTADALTAETLRAVFDIDARVYFDAYVPAHQVVFKK